MDETPQELRVAPESETDTGQDAVTSGIDPDRPPQSDGFDGETADLPADYWVTLVPLTAELVATQLDRLQIKHSVLSTGVLRALFPNYLISINVISNSWISIGATLRRSLPSDYYLQLAGLCQRWNQTKLTSKAYVTVVQAEGASKPQLLPRADCDVLMNCGVAPVQLQALLRHSIRGASEFHDFVAVLTSQKA